MVSYQYVLAIYLKESYNVSGEDYFHLEAMELDKFY